MSSKNKIRWGVIGSGGIARRRTIPEGIMPAKNARLVSVYGTNAKTNREVAKQFGAIAVDSVEALLATGIDAVYVASPVHAHLEQVLACAKASKHVLCEKPLGLNVAEAEKMVTACRKAKVQFGAAFMMRFNTRHQAITKTIREGRLGKPAYARAQLSCWYPPMPNAWRQEPDKAGGGSLIDLGTHCIDLLEMFFGPVSQVSCFINNTIQDYATEDSAVVALKFANGALATVDVFFCIQDDSSKNALELYGSKGGIIATGTIGQGDAGEVTAFLLPEGKEYSAQQARAAAKGIKISSKPRNTYRAEIEEFSNAILRRTSNPLCAEKVGLRNQRMIAACYESAKTGRAVATKK